MSKTFAIGISPNVQRDDIFLVLRLFFSPWKNLNQEGVNNLERWFRDYFGVSHAVSFISGRSALFGVLHEMGIGAGDEVIMQAFTCTVVANAVIATGATSIYADIQDNLTLDPEDVEKKITKKTKALIIQHTFGIPADIEKLLTIAKKHNLFLIEDVAHTIGAKYKSKKLGTFGDVSIFSFGRDKSFSSVWGGMAITSNKIIGQKLRTYQKMQSNPPIRFIYQQLFHPLLTYLALKIYDTINLGKVIMLISQKIGLLSLPVTNEEKQGKFSFRSIHKLPNMLALLALAQVKKLERYNTHRERLVSVYMSNLPLNIQCARSLTNSPLLRFPIIANDPHKVLKLLRRKMHVYAGTWYSNVIDPKGSNFDAIGYTAGTCPRAEAIAKKMINLPILPTMTEKDAKAIATCINQSV